MRGMQTSEHKTSDYCTVLESKYEACSKQERAKFNEMVCTFNIAQYQQKYKLFFGIMNV